MENNIQKEYKRLLSSIKSLIHNLESSKEATHCLLWLAKLDDALPNEKKRRNSLLAKLRGDLLRGHLSYPFSGPPPGGPLSKFMEQNATLTELSNSHLDLQKATGPSSDVPSLDDKTAKYQRRSRECRSSIAHYQNILKSILRASENQAEPPKFLSTPVELQRPSCSCGKEDKLLIDITQTPGTSQIIERIEKLEKEWQEFSLKFNEIEFSFRNDESGASWKKQNFQDKPPKSREGKKRHRRKIRDEMIEKYRSNLLNIVDKKEEIIQQLESQIQNLTKQSADDNSEMEKMLKAKCNELEGRYQKMLDEAAEKHKKERIADREKMERLEQLLFSIGVKDHP